VPSDGRIPLVSGSSRRWGAPRTPSAQPDSTCATCCASCRASSARGRAAEGRGDVRLPAGPGLRITARAPCCPQSQAKLLEVARASPATCSSRTTSARSRSTAQAAQALQTAAAVDPLRADMTKLLSAPDMRTRRGYRNRLILEILYDTAIRRLELSELKLGDLDLGAGYLSSDTARAPRTGGAGQRSGLRADQRLHPRHPSRLRGRPGHGHLILNRFGTPMNPNGIWAWSSAVPLWPSSRAMSAPTACATPVPPHAPQRRPIRHIQEMLGHESLESTQIYTHVTISDLKEVHRKYHPRSAWPSDRFLAAATPCCCGHAGGHALLLVVTSCSPFFSTAASGLRRPLNFRASAVP